MQTKLVLPEAYQWDYVLFAVIGLGLLWSFRVGEDHKHIATIDANGVALAAIQALYLELQQLVERTDEINRLRTGVERLRNTLAVLSANKQTDFDN